MNKDSDDANQVDNDEVTFLTLGDGDFSYSLDLARYLLLNHTTRAATDNTTGNTTDNPTTNNEGKRTVRLIATGIDSSTELHQKYKNAADILKKLQQAAERSVPILFTSALTSGSTGTRTRSANRKSGTTNNKNNITNHETLFNISVRHGVNALDANENENVNNTNNKHKKKITTHVDLLPSPATPHHEDLQAHHVIFNHPHLGTEDAQLHARFLSHFFYTAAVRWVIRNDKNNTAGDEDSDYTTTRTIGKSGVLHLTLVKGQYERWKCQSAAEAHGWLLLERNLFRIPSLQSTCRTSAGAGSATFHPYTNQYHHRRHQTGKSFAPRVQGSETFTFGRKLQQQQQQSKDECNGKRKNNNYSSIHIATCLPWQHDPIIASDSTETSTIRTPTTTTALLSHALFACQYCEKSFAEERSLKNHMKNKHEHLFLCNTTTPIAKHPGVLPTHVLDLDQSPLSLLECYFCRVAGTTRQFVHNQGLDDHIRAKHTALHSTIQPDWYKKQKKVITNVGDHDNCHTNGTAAAGDDATINMAGRSKAGTDDRSSIAVRKDTNDNDDHGSVGSCLICRFRYRNNEERIKHLGQFIPVNSKYGSKSATTTTSSKENYQNDDDKKFSCSFCPKKFRERRAQLQHENFCSTQRNKEQRNGDAGAA